MREFLHILFINLINDVDNGFILLAVIKRYTGRRNIAVLYAALLLTASRIAYVSVIDALTMLPGLRLASSLLGIAMAFRLAFSPVRSYRAPRVVPWIKLTLLLLFTDFTICLDSLVVTAELSTRLITAIFGIFFSLIGVFMLLRLLPEAVIESGWIPIIASGLMTHVAILGLAQDPLIADSFTRMEHIFIATDTISATQIIAVDAAVIMIIIGIVRRMNKQP